jgi:DNA-binding response OmpR family regulator
VARLQKRRSVVDSREIILVVDDEKPQRECISQILKSDGYQVLIAKNGVEALDVLRTHIVDLIVADVVMPDMNGYQLYEQVIDNPQWAAIPFIFLTARALDSDIRYAKELGVDDYLTKPFVFGDLLAAVRGKLRRARRLVQLSVLSVPGTTVSPSIVTVGELKIDTDQYLVSMNGKSIKLSAREFRLLERLARQPKKVVHLEELVRATHDLEAESVDAGQLLRPLVRSLRRKLGYSAGNMGCIQNIRGVGYRLIPLSKPTRTPRPTEMSAATHSCEVTV